MNQLTAAVIGTGFIGPVHVEALQRAGIRVAGILGSTPEKSRAAADALRLPTAYATLDELLADADVDVVHITSPNRFHFEQTSKALAAGKHVLCEKPLAMNATESAELVRLAAAANVAAAVNYNIRYYPLCIEASQQVRNGSLGNVFHVTGSYAQDWLFHPTDFNWRVVSEDGGELRAVADIGTHWLDLVQFVTNRHVVAVCADLATFYPQRERPIGGVETFSGKSAVNRKTETIAIDTEDYGGVMLRFDDNSRGMMWVSQVSAGHKNCLRFELAGSKQALSWCSEDPNELWIGQRDSANQLLAKDPSLVSPQSRAAMAYPGGHNEGFPDTFKQLFLDFYSSIEAKRFDTNSTDISYPTFKDGHREILLCEAILKSHREQRWITVGEKT